jgi:hypothetical protein
VLVLGNTKEIKKVKVPIAVYVIRIELYDMNKTSANDTVLKDKWIVFNIDGNLY